MFAALVVLNLRRRRRPLRLGDPAGRGRRVGVGSPGPTSPRAGTVLRASHTRIRGARLTLVAGTAWTGPMGVV
jgi:hypothetical protein